MKKSNGKHTEVTRLIPPVVTSMSDSPLAFDLSEDERSEVALIRSKERDLADALANCSLRRLAAEQEERETANLLVEAIKKRNEAVMKLARTRNVDPMKYSLTLDKDNKTLSIVPNAN